MSLVRKNDMFSLRYYPVRVKPIIGRTVRDQKCPRGFDRPCDKCNHIRARDDESPTIREDEIRCLEMAGDAIKVRSYKDAERPEISKMIASFNELVIFDIGVFGDIPAFTKTLDEAMQDYALEHAFNVSINSLFSSNQIRFENQEDKSS
jgi:hypothetical protein